MTQNKLIYFSSFNLEIKEFEIVYDFVKKVNIHALDPAIVASIIALTENTKELDLIDTLKKTKCGSDGIGGIKCYGSMFVGYPK